MSMPRAFLRSACRSLCLVIALQTGCVTTPGDIAEEERAVTPVEWIGIGLALIGIAVSAGAWLDAVLIDDTRVSVDPLDDMTLLTGVGVQIPFSATLEFEDTLGYQEPW